MDKATFPFRLHKVIETVSEIDEEASIISWTPAGRTFRIHDLDAFKTQILPKYFPKQSKYKSFRRQLQYYGFFTMGWNHFCHPMFVRKHQELLVHIKHKKATKSSGALQQGDQKKLLSMIPATPSPMEKTACPASSQQQRAQYMSHARQKTLEQQEPEQQELALQRQKTPIASEPGGDTPSVTRYAHISNTVQSFEASSVNKGRPLPLQAQITPSPSNSIIGANHEALAPRTEQQDLLALLHQSLPQRSGYVVPRTKLQAAFMQQRDIMESNMMNHALLMSARTDSDFIELARFQLGL
ncbi:unnamed protein product [Cylindrotheca closterium]|uniref:HSF-type DNA-binding domain-containing protein n=1 Tax=Cylindrotheca closterium TaxID=2856 RepID=A0AAD2G502_9STRA|nr:unnamed protein product [Cylindrotheca closterium]